MAVTPSNSLDILIRTKAELQGAEATAKSLEQQIGKAKALGREHGALDAKLSSVRASIARAKVTQDELSDSFGEAAKKSEFLGLKHSALHKLVHQLGEAFPLAGAAARLFMNPVLVALSAAIAIFTKAKEKLAELNAEMDKASEAAAKPVVSLDQMREALNATVDDIYKMRTEYAHWAKTLSEQSNQITQDLTAETEAFKEQVEAAQELLEARKNLALQRIEADQNLSPEEKARQKFLVETTADSTGRQMKVDAAKVDTQRTLQAFEAVNQKKLSLGDQIGQAEKAVEAARRADQDTIFKADKAGAIAERDRADEDAKRALAKMDKANWGYQVVKFWSAHLLGLPDAPKGNADRKRFEEASREYDSALRRKNDADEKAQRFDDESAKRKAALDKATQALQDLENKAKELKGEFDQLSITLDRLQRHQETLEKSSAAVASVETARKNSEFINKNLNSPAGEALVGAEDIAERSRTGRQVTDQEKQSLIQLASQIAGRTLTFDQSRDYFGRLTHRAGEGEGASTEKDKVFANALEKLTQVLQRVEEADRARAATAAAHPGFPAQRDENKRLKDGFKVATDEVASAVRDVALDFTSQIRALAQQIKNLQSKKGEGGN